MSIVTGDLGKASASVNGPHDSSLAYEKLCIVSANGISYISKKDVPANVQLSNDEYWQPLTDDASAAAAAAAAAEDARNAVKYITYIFSTASDYAAGNYVIHNGKLYRFVTGHTAGAWDPDEVTEVTTAGELETKQAKLTFDATPIEGSLNPVVSGGIYLVTSGLPFITADNGNRNAGFHNSLFRGKYLGSAVSADHWSQIGAGTFDDLFIGDYWNINSIIWRIAAFDYWYHCGDTECLTHHIVIVPDFNLLEGDGSSTHWMHISNTTENGYVGTDFFAGTNSNTGKAQCRSKAQSAFGSAHILTHREYLTNSCKSGSTNVGYPTAGAWYDSDIEMMNEQMVYGCKVFGSRSAGANIPADYTIDKSQLPLFRLAPHFICNRAYWWLRDPVSAANFDIVGYNGLCDSDNASSAGIGVRPAFGIRA